MMPRAPVKIVPDSPAAALRRAADVELDPPATSGVRGASGSSGAGDGADGELPKHMTILLYESVASSGL